jgi:hypothetical protein
VENPVSSIEYNVGNTFEKVNVKSMMGKINTIETNNFSLVNFKFKNFLIY